MKKYLIGLLSIFLIIGGVFFTACGKEVPTLTLSHESIEIELVQDDDEGGYQIVTAEVSGVKNPTIQANAGGYENIIEEVKVQKTSSGKAQILIKGKTEGYGEVVVSTEQGFINKIIKVNVFSYVSFMEQKGNDSLKSNQYVVKGQDNILDERTLIHFEPSEKSRRQITWSLATPTAGAQISGNVLTLSNNFTGNENGEIVLIARTERGIETTITLPVLDKIEGDVRLKWSYSQNSSFEDVSEDNNNFLIVPNYPSADEYEGYVLLDYQGDLQVEKFVLDSEGKETDDIQIASQNPFEGKPLFKVYANKDKKNLNGDYTIYFNIGYKNYDYSITSKDILPLNIKVREKINKITVSTNNEMDVDGSTQTIYTEYASNMGKEYFVNLEPTSVIDGTYKYAIEVEFTEAIVSPICEGKPLEFWYKDAKNGNIWTQIQMVETENGYKTVETNIPSFNNIYIKAASSLNVQTFEGLKVTFISDDNNEVRTSFNAKLVKSVSQSDFVFDDTTFKVDSSETTGEKIIKKRFTLVGQNSVEGIRVVSLSENVTLSQPTYVSDDQNSVTFDISLTLKTNRYGITSLDHYRIEHENGLKSEDFDIDIFLPLKDAAIRYDNANDKSNSVTYYENSTNVYDEVGAVSQASQSLDNIMLKNNTSTIVLYAFNTSNNRSAEAQITIEYYDYSDFRNTYINEIGEDDESDILQAFIALRNDATGIQKILTSTKQTSEIATFTSNNKAITTKGVGFTYAIVKFTGKSAEEQNGVLTLNRIVLIESYISPDGFEVRPNNDSQVTLYANDTVASRDEEETRKHIVVSFANSDVTYRDFSNLIFESTIVDSHKNPVMGDQTIGENSVVWEDGRYAISNINIDGNGINFDIEAITTKGEYSFSDELHLHYVLKNYAGIKVQDIYVRINITIKNAQRVEKLVWENSKDDELYFRVGQNTPYYMVLSTYPQNSKNINLMCLITNENGQEISNFVDINDNISSTTLEVTLSRYINEKMKGYIYILPEDAIYGGQIKYYYQDDNGTERENTISLSNLGAKKDASETWFEYLIENAYFKSNANSTHEATNVNFADILVKAKITVVDGKSFDSAYRVYSIEDFKEIYTNKTSYYTIMSSLDLRDFDGAIDTNIVFEGGIQGSNENVALEVDKQLFDTVAQGAEIRNITLLGNIINTGAGFVAKTNNGKISNVTIDTNGMYSSILSSTGENAEEYVGGIVGINNSLIKDSSVLGLTIIDEECTVGGIAGLNNGIIESSRVEFYNLKKEENYEVNTFTGRFVGAIAGILTQESKILNSFAYSYIDDQVLFGETVGAIAGQSQNARIDYSFAYLYDISSLVGDNQGGTYANYYVSYMEDDEYKTNYVEGYSSNANFVSEGQDGYLSYVNKGRTHLKDLYQDKKVETITGEIQNCTENGYYKSLNAGEGKGILFFYQVKNDSRDLTSEEQKDLDNFNRIDLQQLLGQEISRNINVSSSNSNIVNIIGKELYILKTGKITLSIYSKQDVSLSKEIEISVENAVSEVFISWINNEVTYYVVDGATTYLQTTKSRDYFVEYKIKSLILGNLANRYEIVQNNREFDFSANGENAVLVEKINNNIFKATVNAQNEATLVNVRFNEADAFAEALNAEFAKKFTIIPTEGVIEFSLSEDNIAITPSTNATIRVRIQTTAEDDSVYPVITSENGEILTRSQEENIIKYSLNGKNIIDVQVFSVSEETVGSSKIKTFDVNFAVTTSYRVSEDLTMEVYFASNSGNESKEGQNGTFELVVTRQNFTNIDVANFKISSSQSQYKEVSGKVETVYTTKEQISTLAPGGYGSVLRINVNPEFAYYDYMELSYSGASVVNALYIEKLRKLDDNKDEYIQDSEGIEIVANALRYTPTGNDNGRVYFKLWVNTNVTNDSVFKITAKYYNSNETDPITYVNYYLSVSYLKEPTVEVDGEKIAYVAYGSTADVEIKVLKDQSIDDIGIIGEELKELSILSTLEETIDEERGIKIYKTKLSVSLTAEAKNNVVYVQAQVSRMINGSKEIKTAQATVYLVDFKIDDEKITIEGANDNNLTVWVNVPKAINVNYNLIPEKYIYDASDEENIAEVAELEAKRQEFLNNGYYPAQTTEGNNYYINYKFDEFKHLQKQTLKDRLYYVEDNKDVKIDDSSARAVTAIIDENGNVSLKGNIIGATVRLKLKTYVIVSGEEKLIETIFNITVSAYSDPDIPLLISDATSFKQLDPEYNDQSSSAQIEKNDYILENDIVLEDYKAFSTDRIRSFDGNGHIIYIKNFLLDESNSTLRLALFNEIKKGTTIKNVRVNIYNAGQLTIDKSTFKNINIAGFAIKNAGVIYNSEVIAFYNENCQAVGDIKDLWTSACYYHSNPAGINVKIVNGKNTDEEVYLTDNANWQIQIAGFVLENEGSITNSRVGGEEIVLIKDDVLVGESKSGFTKAETQQLPLFNIIGQGNIAGFALSNSGSIASSYVKNIDLENKTNSTSFYVAGFVGSNTKTIITSYVEGAKIPTGTEQTNFDTYTREGSSIKSTMGYIAGFVYDNNGNVKDSYSNILISNSQDFTKVYLASGFVYKNRGELENCYSASQIRNSLFTQMNFSGVDAQGNLLADGIYTNCYFFNKDFASSEDNVDYSTETQYNTGARAISNPGQKDNFYGFAVASGETDGTWQIDGEAVTIIEANVIALSNRYTLYVEDDTNIAKVGENEKGKYVLPYSTLNLDEVQNIDTSLGGKRNPIIIANEDDFATVFGNSQSTYISNYYNEKLIFGSYRIVNDINLSNLTTAGNAVILPSTTKAFSGTLQGNGFTISGISITSNQTGIAYGLFESLEKYKDLTPTITNTNFIVEQVGAGSVAMVGSIAGYIKDAIIVNIEVELKNQGEVSGLNFAGGIAGFITGKNIIKNIVVINPTVKALQNNADCIEESDMQRLINASKDLNNSSDMNSELIKLIKNMSYAGSVFGVANNYKNESAKYKDSDIMYYDINNVKTNGQVYVKGGVAGGVFGFIGPQTNVRDIGIKIDGTTSSNNSKIIATKHFAGGIVGQSYGALNRVFAVYEDSLQDNIENNLSKFYSGTTSTERGAIDIFNDSEGDFTQEAIGGLVGYTESGKIEISYSKINVTSPSAKYAGGIVGVANVSNANSYQVESTATKYLINEVYATGDVRGSVFAGGIIGAIKGENSRVALKAVNALNAIANYDYSTNQFVQIGEQQTNVSSTLKVNSIVGHFVKDNGDINNIDILNINEYTSYINFIQVKDKESVSQTGENDSQTQEREASVAYYKNYNFSNKAVTLNIFGSIDGNIEICKLYADDLVYALESPLMFTSATIGHTYTQAGFLNSGVWDTSNWNHALDDLFPTIKYTIFADIIYLDNFNIEQTFEQINNTKNAIVMVRGYKSKSIKECTDVDLRGLDVSLIDFSGTLLGSPQYTFGGDQVKIIANKSFIERVAPGFTVKNLIVEYKTETGKIEIGDKGLFVKNEILEGNISNLSLIIDDQVQANIDGGDIGIVTTKLISTSINGLTIKYKNNNNSALLDVTSSGDFNAGLIAGTASQTSEIKVMQIKGVSFDIANAISISGDNTIPKANIGAYFGQATRIQPPEQNAPEKLKITIGSLKNDPTSNITIQPSITNLNVGGIIGYTEGLSYLNIDGQSNIAVGFKLNSNNTNVNAGGIVGFIESNSTLDFNFNKSTLKNTIATANGKTIDSLNAGAVIGKTSGLTPINIKDFGKIDFTVGQEEIKIHSINANIGGIIGYNNSQLSIDDNNNSQSDTQVITDNYYVEATNANVGGVVGISEAQAKVAIKINHATSMSGNISGNNANIGGAIANIDNSSEIEIKAFRYLTGTVVSESSDLVFGGAVGVSNANSLSITNAVFGGVLRIQKANAYICTGGILGSNENQQNATLKIKDCKTYGDVFVDYGNELSSLSSYTYGGIAGYSQSATFDITDNDTLMTSHNIKHSDNAHALFGSGFDGIDSTKNKYNPLYTLTTDDYGKVEYLTTLKNSNNADIISTPEKGHKLNPANSFNEATTAFNSIIYYKLANYDELLNQTTLDNKAIIGDGSTSEYNFNSLDASKKALIDTLTEHSFVSGLIINVNRTFDATGADTYGGLVKEMTENSIVFACQTKGQLSVGGNVKSDVGGLVGQLTSGKIADSSTDIDIIYRGAPNSSISSITNAGSSLIGNCYSAGSITSYVNASLYNFANGGEVINSYSITKLDGRNYVGSANFGGSINQGETAIPTTSQWVKDENYNYGYPTLKYYDFLKVSSWATRGLLSPSNRTGYDACVEEYAYTRAANNTVPSGTKFYMIPNLEIFKNVNKEYNMVLLYDIDASSYDQNVNFTKELDGNGHTISGLTTELFNKLSGATIRNLRLTDAASEGSILTTEIENGTIISNLTLSGTSKKSPLAFESNSATIQAVTNMTVVKSTNATAGGLIGTATNTTIQYCSNYGNIYINSATGEQIDVQSNGIAVGALVGYLASGSIDHSYNVGAVIVGNNDLASKNYFVGGLVGYSQGDITNSYNSGIIKAGHKSNTSQAYAGGIVGYSTANIDTCFNEGSVEALGKNPTTEYKWDTYSDNTPRSLQLVQTNSQNVWAYGIGYIQSGRATNVYEAHLNNRDYIFANGTAREPGGLKTWYWSEIMTQGYWNRAINASANSYNLSPLVSKSIESTQLLRYSDWGGYVREYIFFDTITYRILQDGLIQEDLKPDDVTILSRNKLDLPTSVKIPVRVKLEATLFATERERLSPKRERTTTFTTTIWHDMSLLWENATTDYIKAEPYNNRSINDSLNLSEIKKNNKSSEKINASTIKVAGQDFYLVEGNVSSTIFGAGVYTFNKKIDISDLPYFEDISKYEISQATLDDDNIKDNVKIIGIDKDSKELEINIIYETDPNGKDLNVTVKCNYEENTALETKQNLKFVYVDESSIGIEQTDPINSRSILNGYSLEKGEKTYNQVIKTWKNEDEEHDYSSDTPIYFAYQDNLLIYIPNATLKKADETDTIVNKEILLGENFATAINEFKEKTIKIYTLEKIEYNEIVDNITISGKYENSQETIANNDTITENFTYGKTVNPTIGVTSTEEKIINNYLHATSYDANTTYYVENGGVYTEATGVNANNFSNYYTLTSTHATSYDSTADYFVENAGDFALDTNVDANNFSNYYIVDSITYSHATNYDNTATYYTYDSINDSYDVATVVDDTNFSEYFTFDGSDYIKATTFDENETYYSYDSINEVYTQAIVTADTFSIYYLQNITYTKATNYDIEETYYTENSGIYTQATDVDETNFSEFYTITTAKPTSFDNSATYYIENAGNYEEAVVNENNFSNFYIEDTVTTETKRTHTVSISTINEDTIALSGNTAVFGYQNGFAIPNSFIIDGVTYASTLSSGNIVLTSQTLRNNDTSTMTDEQNTAIEDYFEGLSYIQNQEIDTSSVIRQVSNPTGTLLNDKLSYQKTDIQWSNFEPENEKTSYTYNGITVYYNDEGQTFVSNAAYKIEITNVSLSGYKDSYVVINNNILDDFISTNNYQETVSKVSGLLLVGDSISYTLTSRPYFQYNSIYDSYDISFDECDLNVTQNGIGYKYVKIYNSNIEFQTQEGVENLETNFMSIEEEQESYYYVFNLIDGDNEIYLLGTDGEDDDQSDYLDGNVIAFEWKGENYSIELDTLKAQINTIDTISVNDLLQEKNDKLVIKENASSMRATKVEIEEIWGEEDYTLPEYSEDLVVWTNNLPQDEISKYNYDLNGNNKIFIISPDKSNMTNILKQTTFVEAEYANEDNYYNYYVKTLDDDYVKATSFDENETYYTHAEIKVSPKTMSAKIEENIQNITTPTPLSIILEKDISFDENIQITKEENVNIIGNNHIIKFRNDSGFYTSVASNGSFIKDISFLGENTLYVVSSNSTNTTFNNVSVYSSKSYISPDNNNFNTIAKGDLNGNNNKSYVNATLTNNDSISSDIANNGIFLKITQENNSIVRPVKGIIDNLTTDNKIQSGGIYVGSLTPDNYIEEHEDNSRDHKSIKNLITYYYLKNGQVKTAYIDGYIELVDKGSPKGATNLTEWRLDFEPNKNINWQKNQIRIMLENMFASASYKNSNTEDSVDWAWSVRHKFTKE